MPQNPRPEPGPLSSDDLIRAVRLLGRRDPDLKAVTDRLGPPPLWSRRPGFPALVQIILEQQVSLASARAVFRKLKAICRPLIPGNFLTLDDASLRRAGFSRQKSRYCRELARSIQDGSLKLPRMKRQSDESVREELIRVKGIGPWTANIYLLMALGRPDIWPTGDLALALALQDVKGLKKIPDEARQLQIAEAWRPYRAVAARLLWHHYLNPVGSGRRA